MKVTYEIIVRGRVQGVGFRWFVKNQAELIGIKGYVKNQGNGNVLIIAQGEETNLGIFIPMIRNGSDFSNISSTEVTLITSAADYKDFFIAH